MVCFQTRSLHASLMRPGVLLRLARQPGTVSWLRALAPDCRWQGRQQRVHRRLSTVSEREGVDMETFCIDSSTRSARYVTMEPCQAGDTAVELVAGQTGLDAWLHDSPYKDWVQQLGYDASFDQVVHLPPDKVQCCLGPGIGGRAGPGTGGVVWGGGTHALPGFPLARQRGNPW